LIYLRRHARHASRPEFDGEAEIEADLHTWYPGLPPVPQGAKLALTRSDAEYQHDRILSHWPRLRTAEEVWDELVAFLHFDGWPRLTQSLGPRRMRASHPRSRRGPGTGPCNPRIGVIGSASWNTGVG
jgi:hypothetical protein